MQMLSNMDMDTMVIALPTALIVMYLVISIQRRLSNGKNPHLGLILPGISFIISTILAVRPLLLVEDGMSPGLLSFCLRMWLTFNIVTLVFLFPYYMSLRTRKAAAASEKPSVTAPSADDVPEEGGNEDEDDNDDEDDDMIQR